jgi:hypothetical protein
MCQNRLNRSLQISAVLLAKASGAMAKLKTVGLRYGALRKECLEAVRQWPGCESVAGIQIVRSNKPGQFSVRITLYGKADVKTAERAIACVQREKRRQFHLIE